MSPHHRSTSHLDRLDEIMANRAGQATAKAFTARLPGPASRQHAAHEQPRVIDLVGYEAELRRGQRPGQLNNTFWWWKQRRWGTGSTTRTAGGVGAGSVAGMKYVACVPDGCADGPVDGLDGRTLLEVASVPTLTALAGRGEVRRAAVIPGGPPPGSDVGSVSILGYDPGRHHAGRAPIEAAGRGIELASDEVAYRCNLVTIAPDGTRVDFAGGHPTTEKAGKVLLALQEELAGGDVRFYPGVQDRHLLVTPGNWLDARCVPPDDLSGRAAVWPTGPAAPRLQALMDASRPVLSRFGGAATQIWLWGQGTAPVLPDFGERRGLQAGSTTAVDLIRGLGVQADIEVVEVAGATGWYARDRRLLAPLVEGLDELGAWRLLLLPDHATPVALRTHISDPAPWLLVDSELDGPGGIYSEAGVAASAAVPGHTLMDRAAERQRSIDVAVEQALLSTVPARMPQAAPHRRRELLGAVPHAVAAVVVLGIYLGLPLTLAARDLLGALGNAVMLALAVLVLVGLTIFAVLRGTSRTVDVSSEETPAPASSRRVPAPSR